MLNRVVIPIISIPYALIWMDILLLTIFLSVILASLFIVLFVSDRERSKRSSLDQDSLLPLAEEGSVPATCKVKAQESTLKD